MPRRIRSVKPDHLEDPHFGRLSFPARVMYRELPCFMDKQGLIWAEPILIRTSLFLYNPEVELYHVTYMIKELVNAGYWEFLETKRGQLLIHDIHFENDHKPHHREKSSLPDINDLTPVDESLGLARVESGLSRGSAPLYIVHCPLSPEDQGQPNLVVPDRSLESPVEEKPTTKGGRATQLKDLWNKYAHKVFPRVRALSPNTERGKMARARWGEHPSEEYWIEVIERMNQSAFLRGESSDWKASFDFLIQPDRHAYILEGKYDDKGGGPTKKQGHKFS